MPGRFLVNIFPSLRHVPSWFPGAGFQRFLARLARMSFETRYPPFEEAKKDFVGSVFLDVCRVLSLTTFSIGEWKERQTS
jgi:hypothetical protein